jgi:uncharacterized membrane protein (DUF4010 family)
MAMRMTGAYGVRPAEPRRIGRKGRIRWTIVRTLARDRASRQDRAGHMDDLRIDTVFGLLAALGGGLLVGIQRERRKREGEAAAGVRSFTVVALIGAVAALLGPVAIGVGGAAVAAMAVASYWHSADHDPGLTTELALLATFLLGALALAQPQLGASLFVALAALLQSKEVLHDFTRRVLSEREVDDALLFAASVLIVLPLLPDRAFDPWGVLNLRNLWLVAVLVMAINAGGYIAHRAFGSRVGLVIAGFFGGFVSSAATIAGMGQRAASDPALRTSCIAAALLSCVATVVEIALILSVIAPALLRHVTVPLLVAGATAVLATLAFVRRDQQSRVQADKPSGRPFAFGPALLFAGIVAVALLVSKVMGDRLGTGGVLAAAAATGFADVHAATVTLGQLVGAGLSVHDAGYALAAAFTTNSIVKCIAAGTGGVAYASAVIIGVLSINAALCLAVVWL